MFEAIDAIAVAQGDDCDAVGDQRGVGGRKGDVVVAIDACAGPARGRIVFEAKSAKLSKNVAMAELSEALVRAQRRLCRARRRRRGQAPGAHASAAGVQRGQDVRRVRPRRGLPPPSRGGLRAGPRSRADGPRGRRRGRRRRAARRDRPRARGDGGRAAHQVPADQRRHRHRGGPLASSSRMAATVRAHLGQLHALLAAPSDGD